MSLVGDPWLLHLPYSKFNILPFFPSHRSDVGLGRRFGTCAASDQCRVDEATHIRLTASNSTVAVLCRSHGV